MLAKLKSLRGTPLDVFGYAQVRREERELIVWYRNLIEQVLIKLTPENLPTAIEIASLPDQIRGYEKIKSDSVAQVKTQAADKLGQMSKTPDVHHLQWRIQEKLMHFRTPSTGRCKTASALYNRIANFPTLKQLRLIA